mmetsp:Transcript_10174/g.15177  ORF Transcript_10174/g.15177 Transcript_10174/m.15177 type:complete len:342 (-) Transcript_10174:268-1293(-)
MGKTTHCRHTAASLTLLLSLCCVVRTSNARTFQKLGSIRTRPKHLSPLRGGGIGDGRSAWSINKRNQQQQQSVNRSNRQSAFPIVEDLDDSKSDTAQQTLETMEAFLSRDTRQKFIARVYAILSGQLSFTTLVVLFFSSNKQLVAQMLQHGNLVPFLSLGVSTVAWFIICSSERARQSSPLKWQLLSIFTIAESIVVGIIASFYSMRAVILGLSTTAVTTGIITAYTFLQKNPKYDLTQWGSSLASAGLIFLLMGILRLLVYSGILPAYMLPASDLMHAGIGATLFSFYLAYHTRVIVGGKHAKYQMNEKDYVFGAMALYSDIINMFIYMLEIFGGASRDR